MRFLLILLTLVGLAMAAPAGTVIRNQVTAVVEDQTYLSNIVETEVQAQCVPQLWPQGSVALPARHVSAPPGGFAYFNYQLKNSGNAPFDFALGWTHSQSSVEPQAVTIFHDLNRNALLDPGEPPILAVRLEPEEELYLVVEVRLATGSTGDLYLSPTATCPDGTRDDDNYSHVRVGRGPTLVVEKSVDSAAILPGGEVRFNARVKNIGDSEAFGPIYLRDPLGLGQLAGLSLVEGSVQAGSGLLEYSDNGSTWSTTPGLGVSELRLRLEGLGAGEQAEFSFLMRSDPNAPPGPRRNLALYEWEGNSGNTQVEFEVLPRYEHHLGPEGNPRALSAGEGSPNDRQQGYLISGGRLCFQHSLLNAGTIADRYWLELAGLPSGVNASLETLAATPLAQPIELEVGQVFSFQICLQSPQPLPGFDLTLTALSAQGHNRTLDRVQGVLDPAGIGLLKQAQPADWVEPGGALEYTLEVENTLPTPLTQVVVEDTLQAGLVFIAASDGGSYDPASRTVRWNLPSLQPGQKKQLLLQTRVAPDVPFDSLLENRFRLRIAELLEPKESNTVVNRVALVTLLLSKSVNPLKAQPGDSLTYTLTLHNPNTAALKVRLEDIPAAGLGYVAGSAEVGARRQEPLLQGGKLIWEGLELGPQQTLRITYRMRVLAGTSGSLINTAQAQGTTAGGFSVASSQAQATVLIEPGVFTPANFLLGRVFLDANRNQLFDPGELPVAGARLVLDNGLQTTTDAQGRYAFRDLSEGLWTVMLDPVSAPFARLPHSEAGGDGYRHRVRVLGLTVSDFALEMPLGSAKVVRETVLEFGPLRIRKKLMQLPSGWAVVLEVSSAEVLNQLTISDPIPGSAPKVFEFEQFQGTQTLVYDLPGGELTDPQARWRYP